MSYRANISETSNLEALHRVRNWLLHTKHKEEEFGKSKTYEFSEACWRNNAEEGIRALEYFSTNNLSENRKTLPCFHQRTMGDLFTHFTHCMNILTSDNESLDPLWTECLNPLIMDKVNQRDEWERAVNNIVRRPCCTMPWRAIDSASIISGDSTLKHFTGKNGNEQAYVRWRNERAMTKLGDDRNPSSTNYWNKPHMKQIGNPQMRHVITQVTIASGSGIGKM